MIGYVTLGTNDLARAAAFYDKIAEALGTKRMMESDAFIAWGERGGGVELLDCREAQRQLYLLNITPKGVKEVTPKRPEG